MRGLGFLPDPAEIVEAELVAHNARALVPSPTRSPEVFTWVPTGAVPVARDQETTSSCVSQSIVASATARAALLDRKIEPSVMALYAFSRLLESPRALLHDTGSSPSRAIEAARSLGFVAESRWPFSVARIDVQPPIDIFQAGQDARLGQHYRITPGRGAARAIKEAVVAGYFPIFSMSVDEAYDRYDGSDVYRAPSGRVLGRHMQTIVGYAYDDFEVLNSWGTGWGRDGMSRIAGSILESSDVISIIVPTVVPTQVF